MHISSWCFKYYLWIIHQTGGFQINLIPISGARQHYKHIEETVSQWPHGVWCFSLCVDTPAVCINFWKEQIHWLGVCSVLILYQNGWKKLFWRLPRIRGNLSSVRICWAGRRATAGSVLEGILDLVPFGSRQLSPGWSGSRAMLSALSLCLWSSACGLLSLGLLPYRRHCVHTTVFKGGREEAKGSYIPPPPPSPSRREIFPRTPKTIPFELIGQNQVPCISLTNHWQRNRFPLIGMAQLPFNPRSLNYQTKGDFTVC